MKMIRMPRWAAVLALIAGLLLGILLLAVAAGLALIVIPVAAIAALVLRWRFRRRAAQTRERHDVIEVDYRVVDREP